MPPSGPVWAGAGAQIRLGLQCTGEGTMLRCGGARFLLFRRVRQRRDCRLVFTCNRLVFTCNRLGRERAQSFSQVRADPMKAMTSVLALCKHGGVPNGFC